jgi:pyridoxamine 5'-phosphate oxidase
MENPITKFRRWYRVAGRYELHPDACLLITTANDVSARIVLLKGITDDGFIFYTNYKSAKALQMEQSGKVCMFFYWNKLSRQVIIKGMVEKVSREQSEAYFNSRPYLSKIGAWASTQSQPLSRVQLYLRCLWFIFKFKATVPCPNHWGGYLIRPYSIEFWQMRQFRLHIREVYSINNNGWHKVVLAP